MQDTGKRTGEKPRGKRMRRRPSRLTGRQKLLAAAAVLLALAVAAAAAHRKMVVRPDVENKPQDATEQDGAEQLDYGGGIRPKVDGQRKSEDFYTVLILGRDTGGGGNTDTMLLASYDVTNQKAAVMSIPRDTMVNVSWDVKKINSVYNSCGGGDEGIEGLYKEIAQLVGFEPDFRVVLEWEAVGALVEAIGGVEFDVPYNMDYDDDVQNLHIHQMAGLRRLSGEDAMQVIRWRENNNNSPYGYRKKDGGIGDAGRMKVQQDFLKAVIRQTLTIQNAPNLRKIAKVFQEHVDTDLEFSNICWFAEQAVLGGLQVEHVEFFTMPYQGANAYSRYYTKHNGTYTELAYVTPVADKLLEIVNGKLSPFAETFTLADLDIMSVNADGSISSTTGHVEDKQAAKPPVKPAQEEPAAAPVDGNAADPSGGPVTDPGVGTVPDPNAGTEADPGTTSPGVTDPGAEPPITTPDTPADPGTNVPDAPADPGSEPGGFGDGGFAIIDQPPVA